MNPVDKCNFQLSKVLISLKIRLFTGVYHNETGYFKKSGYLAGYGKYFSPRSAGGGFIRQDNLDNGGDRDAGLLPGVLPDLAQ